MRISLSYLPNISRKNSVHYRNTLLDKNREKSGYSHIQGLHENQLKVKKSLSSLALRISPEERLLKFFNVMVQVMLRVVVSSVSTYYRLVWSLLTLLGISDSDSDSAMQTLLQTSPTTNPVLTNKTSTSKSKNH